MRKKLALHFRRATVDKTITLLFHLSDRHPVSKVSLVSFISYLLHQVGIDPSHYSGHSFRIGGATSASLAGLTDYEIKLLGRWNSDFYQRYTLSPSVVARYTPQHCTNAHDEVSVRHSLQVQ